MSKSEVKGGEGMNNKKFISWLYSQLPTLVKKDIISERAAENIHDYYGEVAPEDKIKGVITAFAVIGAVLIGLGIILIFAYNWNDLPKLVKVGLSFVPLVASLALSYFAVTKRAASAAWREGMAIFWSLSVGATIALISQTYHLSGDMSQFLLIWLLLALPVIYIMDAVVAAAVYMFLTILWAAFAQWEGGTAWFFWVLFAAVIPFFVSRVKKANYSGGTIWLGWLISFCLAAGTGISLEKCVPGLWIIIYISLSAFLYLLNEIVFPEGETMIKRPFQTYGIISCAGLLWQLTFKWPWHYIGWDNYRDTGLFHANAAALDYILAAGLPIAALVMLFKFSREGKKLLLDLGVAPVFAILAYIAAAFTQAEMLATMIMNAYVFYLGVAYIYNGIKHADFTAANGGMLLLSALIVSRFFDMDMSILWRGLVFILIGAGFIIANNVISRRKGALK